MPILKPLEKSKQLWKAWDEKANKEGLHGTFYTTNQNQYVGEWHANKKEGKGVFNWIQKGEIYEGEWKDDKRNGFGNLSVKQPDGSYKKVYSGGWKNDKKHGYGTFYLDEKNFYEGEFYCNNRSGWGRMYYDNGDIYEGEWSGDVREGKGMLRLGKLLIVVSFNLSSYKLNKFIY